MCGAFAICRSGVDLRFRLSYDIRQQGLTIRSPTSSALLGNLDSIQAAMLVQHFLVFPLRFFVLPVIFPYGTFAFFPSSPFVKGLALNLRSVRLSALLSLFAFVDVSVLLMSLLFIIILPTRVKHATRLFYGSMYRLRKRPK